MSVNEPFDPDASYRILLAICARVEARDVGETWPETVRILARTVAEFRQLTNWLAAGGFPPLDLVGPKQTRPDLPG